MVNCRIVELSCSKKEVKLNTRLPGLRSTMREILLLAISVSIMSFSRSSTVTLGRENAPNHQSQLEADHVRPEPTDLDLLDEDRGDPFPKRLIIAVDFGTTYSAVSYVDVPQGCPSDSVDSRSIRSIGNYPENYNYGYNDPMGMEVPTEVMYPLDRHFRDHFNLDNPEEHLENGDGVEVPVLVPDEDGDISMLSDVSEEFRWGYRVHEVWNRPSTHSNTTNQPLSRFKLLLDTSERTESVRQELRQTINTLKRRNVIQGHLHVIADFLTYLLEHTRSQLRRQGFDDSYEKEMILCVPAIWTQKACRDMQACLAVAMKRASFTKVGLQNKSVDNLFIVSEPEAAAAYMLSTSAEIKV